jgi:uncharacterized membrane protein
MKMNKKDWIEAAVIAAIYVVITWGISPLAFGPLQFRISESLKALALRGRKYIYALTVGLFLANLGSPQVGVWELVLMPVACFTGGEIAYRLRKVPLLALTFYGAWIGTAVGITLHLAIGLPLIPTIISVSVTEIPLIVVGEKIVAYLLRVIERRMRA